MDILSLYTAMKRIRMVEAAIADNYNNEIREMHTPIHLYDGQEAVAVGVCSNLIKEDFVFSNHRSHGHYLAKGGNLNKMMAELHNKKTGCCKGRGASMHLMDKNCGVALTSSIVAGNVSIGTGYALAEQMKNRNTVVVVFFGDGASEEGSVYESICFAQLKKLPIVFVCENNLYSIATPMDRREPNEDISSKFQTVLPIQKVNGNDVIDVYEASQTAVNAARKGEGPRLLECMTYRLRDHHNIGNGIDGRFRTEQELKNWENNCPIKKLKRKLILEDLVDEKQLEEEDKKIAQEIEAAFVYARESACPDADELFNGLWG
ncbi:thiamine pyrophosphate-dependent dehydrogenase E1 component subunit alpha [Parablautia muri]|uniref:Thiamine pyrophosphate-dependent dehydrogenase E1 component subunit alpha n=1 Tax=Parablautia muri TaxID=2320879 RepID=A0A9X5BEH2_9FIRM|nr:thiamine pyrophosphate-dependent dehydrogenase E1 component subunit alpha [Parablautia muri]NBJ92536.1 thiamine pyrophosphate-dependent dehydrogenase E1 component subunit alpha [Parablautia muri]